MRTQTLGRPNMKLFFFAFLLVLLGACGIQAIPTQKNEVDASWAEIMNQYKRRHDLIPALVGVVSGYAKHEKETLTSVIEARASATRIELSTKDVSSENIAKVEAAQKALSGALARLLVSVERYPDLKANTNFLELQSQLEGTENRIAVARNRYIQHVKEFNNLVTVVPSSFTNKVIYHYTPLPQLDLGSAEELEKAPEIKL